MTKQSANKVKASRQKAKQDWVRRHQRAGRGDRSRRCGEQVWRGGARAGFVNVDKDGKPRHLS